VFGWRLPGNSGPQDVTCLAHAFWARPRNERTLPAFSTFGVQLFFPEGNRDRAPRLVRANEGTQMADQVATFEHRRVKRRESTR